MPTVEASVVVPAPRAAVFALAQDYGVRLRWDPFLREMRFLDGAPEAAAGVRVFVRARNSLGMTVRYVTLRPPAAVAVKMTDGPRLFETFGGTWLFDEEDGGAATRVVFRYGFRTRWPALRPVLDRVIAAVFRRDVRARLRGLRAAAADPFLIGPFLPAAE